MKSIATVVNAEDQKSIEVSVRVNNNGVSRVSVAPSLTFDLEAGEFYRLAEVFGKAKLELDRVTALQRRDSATKAAANSFNAYKSELARRMKEALCEVALIEAVRNAERSTQIGRFIADSYRDIMDDEKDRAARGVPFWEYHGEVVYDALVNVMTEMNSPHLLPRRTETARRVVDILAGSRKWNHR